MSEFANPGIPPFEDDDVYPEGGPPINYAFRQQQTADMLACLLATLAEVQVHEAQGQLFDASDYVRSDDVLPPM